MARRLPGTLVAVVASLTLASSLVIAQTPAPQRLQIQIVNVKPEAVNDWLALQQKETIPALKKIGVAFRDAWTTSIFGESFEYHFATPITTFANYDNPQAPMVRALGEEGARAYNAKVRQMIVSQRMLAINVLPESIVPPPTFQPRFVVLNFNYVIPGRAADYRAYLRDDLMPAIRKNKPAAYGVGQTIHGGDANEFVTASYFDKMADLDGPSPVARALGTDGAAKLFAKNASMLQRHERRIYRFVPNLSFRQGVTSSQP